jgi:regulator of replication initiation timing
MINEKVKQLEDNFNETIIPNLQKKITTLESENSYLHEHAKKLQEMLTNLAIEYKKQQKQVCNTNLITSNLTRCTG